MHRSVMQNKKYIKFADKNTVEVIAIGGATAAVKSGHKKAGTYKAKNAAGEEVEYLLEFPGMTAAGLSILLIHARKQREAPGLQGNAQSKRAGG